MVSLQVRLGDNKIGSASGHAGSHFALDIVASSNFLCQSHSPRSYQFSSYSRLRHVLRTQSRSSYQSSCSSESPAPAQPNGKRNAFTSLRWNCRSHPTQSFSTSPIAKADVSKLTLIGRLGTDPVEREVRLTSGAEVTKYADMRVSGRPAPGRST